RRLRDRTKTDVCGSGNQGELRTDPGGTVSRAVVAWAGDSPVYLETSPGGPVLTRGGRGSRRGAARLVGTAPDRRARATDSSEHLSWPPGQRLVPARHPRRGGSEPFDQHHEWRDRSGGSLRDPRQDDRGDRGGADLARSVLAAGVWCPRQSIRQLQPDSI